MTDYSTEVMFDAEDARTLIEQQKSEIRRLIAKCELSEAEREANVKGFAESFSTVKSEAIKEFAERLKKELRTGYPIMDKSICDIIDNLAKELTEDEG